MSKGSAAQMDGSLSSLPRYPSHSLCEMGELTQTGEFPQQLYLFFCSVKFNLHEKGSSIFLYIEINASLWEAYGRSLDYAGIL